MDVLIGRARALMSFPDVSAEEASELLVGAGHAPMEVYLAVKAACQLPWRWVPREGQAGFCPTCGAAGVFVLGEDGPAEWISRGEGGRWECHECFWWMV